MNILLAGATGFIGRPLIRWLRNQGHVLTVLTRAVRQPEAGIRWLAWDATRDGEWVQQIGEAEAIINLSGEPLAQGRWTAGRKESIRQSRIDSTRVLVKVVQDKIVSPQVFINASAIGYYGDRGDSPLEESSDPGCGFLAEVCQQWEATAQLAAKQGPRVVLARFGVVLGQGGGMLAKMIPQFRLFLGGRLGQGNQWMSWIHIRDLISALDFVLRTPALQGPVNLVSPQPVTQREFSQKLGKSLGRPHWLPVPGMALRLALGEMADMVLGSQRVIPGQLQQHGFSFHFPDLKTALTEIAGLGAHQAGLK